VVLGVSAEMTSTVEHQPSRIADAARATLPIPVGPPMSDISSHRGTRPSASQTRFDQNGSPAALSVLFTATPSTSPFLTPACARAPAAASPATSKMLRPLRRSNFVS
jgi:hypothetical protein